MGVRGCGLTVPVFVFVVCVMPFMFADEQGEDGRQQHEHERLDETDEQFRK